MAVEWTRTMNQEGQYRDRATYQELPTFWSYATTLTSGAY